MNRRLRVSRTLSSTVGQRLKEPLRRILESVGYDLVSLTRDETIRVQNLFRAHRVASVIDVGANQGQYARRMRTLGFEGAIVSYEPGKEAFALLKRQSRQDARWSAIQIALGSASGTAELHVSRNSVSSSLLEIQDRHIWAEPESKTRYTESVIVRRLDDVATDVKGPIWLKIDTQGSELDVLRGATHTLARCTVLQIEVSLSSLYAGQADTIELLQYLSAAGFIIFDLVPGFRDPGTAQLLQCDLVALRRTEDV